MKWQKELDEMDDAFLLQTAAILIGTNQSIYMPFSCADCFGIRYAQLAPELKRMGMLLDIAIAFNPLEEGSVLNVADYLARRFDVDISDPVQWGKVLMSTDRLDINSAVRGLTTVSWIERLLKEEFYVVRKENPE